jgi:hypothetical protein
MDPDHSITDLQNLSDLFIMKFGIDSFQLAEQHLRYF